MSINNPDNNNDNEKINYNKLHSKIPYIINAGNTPSIEQGPLRKRPLPGIIGRLFLDVTHNIIYRDNGKQWEQLGSQTPKMNKGDKGEQGIQGTQGLKGDKGDQGIPGLQGDKGDQGPAFVPGHDTQSLGLYSLAEGDCTIANGEASHAEGFQTKANGDFSHTEGFQTEANSRYSHVEGYKTKTIRDYSHAEGIKTEANKFGCHVEGLETKANGNYSHAEGTLSEANGECCHAEGYKTQANGNYCHTEGYTTTATGNFSHTEGYNTKANGNCSHAEGAETQITSDYSHAEGFQTKTTSIYAHAEGYKSEVNGNSSHAEGTETKANGFYCHSEGYQTQAIGASSHSEGFNTKANGASSHAEGYYTTSNGLYCHIMGRFGDSSAGSVSSWFLANGTSSSNKGLAAKILNNGNAYADGSWYSTGADYAEMFETVDGNTIEPGYFIALEEDKIRKANNTDTFILGITSTSSAFVGNIGELRWKNKFLTDQWRKIQYQDVIVPEVKDADNNIIIPSHTESQPILNPLYDNTKEYIPREKRDEWVTVGLIGRLLLRDDGTCLPNGYCKPTDDGIATASPNGYRVLKRTGSNQILIFFSGNLLQWHG